MHTHNSISEIHLHYRDISDSSTPKKKKKKLTKFLLQKCEEVKVLLRPGWLNFQTLWPSQTWVRELRPKRCLDNNQARQLFISGRGREQSWPWVWTPDTSITRGVCSHCGETDWVLVPDHSRKFHLLAARGFYTVTYMFLPSNLYEAHFMSQYLPSSGD